MLDKQVPYQKAIVLAHLLFYFETRSHHIAQVGLVLTQ